MILLFYYISLLNLADAAMTVAGIENSVIIEANPLERIYSIDIRLFIALKVLLSMAVLLLILYKKVPQSNLVKVLTVFAAGSYTTVVFMHSYWLVQLA